MPGDVLTAGTADTAEVLPGAPLALARTAPPEGGGLAPGTRVGRYTVLRTLAQGGMGIVYLAYDPELDRRVALKLLLASSGATGGTVERLLREAQAMARLSDPNVVAVYDVGTHEGRVFLAMEYIDGVTLDAWRRARPRACAAILEVYVQAGRGLQAAHAAGILHRDFKPDNVVVDASGRARVLDFGVARIDSASTSPIELAHATTAVDAPGGSDLTLAGALVGTPGYMAPEQLRGERADARSDVFSFSLALYEALYGERPFGGRTLHERLGAIVGGEVSPPARGSAVPRALRTLVLRGLRARPDDRWQTMGAMLDALERAVKVRRVGLGGAVAVALTVVGALVFAARPVLPRACASVAIPMDETWSPVSERQVRSRFESSGNPRARSTFDRVRQELDAYAARWKTMAAASCEATRQRGAQSEEALALRSACLDSRREELKSTIALLEDASAARVDDSVAMVTGLSDLRACADVPSLRARYGGAPGAGEREELAAARRRLAQGTALVNARAFEEATALLGPTAALARPSNERGLECATLLLLGRAELGRGEVKGAARTLFEAAVEANAVRDAETEASAWIWLVRVAGYDLGQVARSGRYARLAEAALERAGNPPTLRADLLRHRAHVMYAHGELEGCLPLYEEARSLRLQVFGAESPLVGELDVDIADVHAAEGEPVQAIAIYQSAQEKRSALYGPGDPVVGLISTNLALAHVVVGDGDKALEAARRALEAIRPGERLHPVARFVLALAVIESGDAAAGVAEAAAALAEVESGPGGVKPASLREALAEVLMRRHLVEASEREASASEEGLGGPDGNPRLLREARAMRALGDARSGHIVEALAMARPILAEQDHQGRPSSPALLYPLLAVGEASLLAQDLPSAIGALERAVAISDRSEAYPELRADARLALARALAAAHQDADRARALADRAATGYEALRLPDLAREARTLASPASPLK